MIQKQNIAKSQTGPLQIVDRSQTELFLKRNLPRVVKTLHNKIYPKEDVGEFIKH